MKKFLSLISILFITSFMGILSVFAVDSSITKSSFSWSGVTNFSVCKLKCSNANITGGDISSSDVLKSANGSVTFTSSKNQPVTCSIYAAKELTGNDVDEQITSKTFGTTTTKPPETPATTAPQTTQPTTTIAPKSNNANLKTLVIKGDDDSDVSITPVFNPGIYEYSATVSGTVKTVQINATMEDAKSNMVMSNNANEELIAGENNKITITVTAEDGTKKAYVLNIKREALTADATLKELTIEESKGFKLKDDKFTYTVKVSKNVKELTITYVLSDMNSSVEIEGNENLKDGSIVKVIVTAQDGTKKVYTLNISKEVVTTKVDTSKISTEKNPLIIMGLSIIAFGLIGGIIYVIKK